LGGNLSIDGYRPNFLARLHFKACRPIRAIVSDLFRALRPIAHLCSRHIVASMRAFFCRHFHD
jgi:hypothetical protein